jgi:hypothetical protein
MMKGAIATARICGQRVLLIQHQWMSSFLVTPDEFEAVWPGAYRPAINPERKFS